jgi:hypothetical protein
MRATYRPLVDDLTIVAEMNIIVVENALVVCNIVVPKTEDPSGAPLSKRQAPVQLRSMAPDSPEFFRFRSDSSGYVRSAWCSIKQAQG